MSLWTSARVQQIVAANHLRIWIRQERERITGLTPEIFGNFWRVNADGHRPDAVRGKILKLFFDAS
jgi:hypothetical protein